MSSDFSDVFLYAGDYLDLDDAQDDFDAFEFLHNEGWIGKYQAAIFEKNSEGKVKVIDTTSTTRTTGAKWGAAVGAVVGLLFPPSIIASAGIGALAGAGAGNVAKIWFGDDIKTIGESLDAGHAGVIIVAEATPDVGVERLLARAAKAEKHAAKVEAKELQRALEEEA